MIRDALTCYLTGWFGIDVVPTLSRINTPDVIITDESDLAKLINVLPDALDNPGGPMIVVMCTAASRRSKNNNSKSPNLEAVSYPFGPYKLARCIRLCLEKIERGAVAEADTESQASAAAPDDTSEDSRVEEVVLAVEQVTLSNPDSDSPDINLIRSGRVLAYEDSIHAGLLVEGGTASSGGSQEKNEYPFPLDEVADGTISPSNLDVPIAERPSLASRRTISPTLNEIALRHQPAAATIVSGKGAMTASPVKQQEVEKRIPRLLLVDDNKVNLRLLQTFMKKRSYTDVYSAEDGHQAVSVFQDLLSTSPSRPPDIIFMDISMPVMNGFEATRKIREIELQYRERSPNPLETPPSSLIIALTGLASGRDQSEAFTSGFDLYLVKPISFREVGRLLDNWEKSGGAATVGVPHGAVTGGEPPASVSGAGAGVRSGSGGVA